MVTVSRGKLASLRLDSPPRAMLKAWSCPISKAPEGVTEGSKAVRLTREGIMLFDPTLLP